MGTLGKGRRELTTGVWFEHEEHGDREVGKGSIKGRVRRKGYLLPEINWSSSSPNLKGLSRGVVDWDTLRGHFGGPEITRY